MCLPCGYMRVALFGGSHLAFRSVKNLADALLLVGNSEMLLDAVQPRGISCEHALEEFESFVKLFEDFFRRKVFSHSLS